MLKRVLLALFAAFATLAVAAPVVAAPAPATPIPAPPAPGPLAYYMMQGDRIISQPFTSGPACIKALLAFQKTLPANIAPIVCAHRRP